MPINRVARKMLQRYWRFSRGLTLGARGMVLDGEGRVLLVRHASCEGWYFPGGGVEKDENIGAALARKLAAQAGVIIGGPPEMIGLFANFHSSPSDHIALFKVCRWTRPHPRAANGEIAEQRFFAPGALPDGTCDGARARVAELLDGRAPAPHWSAHAT